MRYKFFTNSERSWQAMFEAIKSARESVYLEMYIFASDMVQYDFLLLLKEKAKSGLSIKIILDSVGSRELNNNAIASLRASGAEVIFLSYFFHRTHRKILVVDSSRAFIGGVNLSQKFRFWNDLVVEVTGKRLVAQIIRSFAKAYNEYGGRDSKIIAGGAPEVSDQTSTWLIEHFPSRKKFSLKNIYKQYIGAAKENIILATPYFMPRRWLIASLHQAVLRGVRVEILAPQVSDSFFVDRVNYFYMFKLAKLGVNFYLEPVMNHAKAMLLDNREGIVGSHNLDFLSFEYNAEVGIFLKDADAVRRLSEIMEVWKKGASLFDYKTFKPTWVDYILSPLIRLFAKII